MIRNASVQDISRLLEIYSYYVLHTAISFEYDVPTPEEFTNRMINIQKTYPYIVIEENNKILGYAYAQPFIHRKAYDYSAELTIYLDKDAKGKGYGKQLYSYLEERCKNMGITNLYACIGITKHNDPYINNNSEQFHQHLGFKTIGYFSNCGYKFDRWYDMIYMEKIISDYPKYKEILIKNSDI